MDAQVFGVISDTHGLLRPSALDALSACSLIVHAGDIGGPEVLAALSAVAPVIAVRGNVDHGAWAAELPETEVVPAGTKWLYVLHNLQQLALDPAAGGFSAVISGHSHKPTIAERGGVLYINPGSAGPRRFHLPITLARLTVRDDQLNAELIELAP